MTCEVLGFYEERYVTVNKVLLQNIFLLAQKLKLVSVQLYRVTSFRTSALDKKDLKKKTA